MVWLYGNYVTCLARLYMETFWHFWAGSMETMWPASQTLYGNYLTCMFRLYGNYMLPLHNRISIWKLFDMYGLAIRKLCDILGQTHVEMWKLSDMYIWPDTLWSDMARHIMETIYPDCMVRLYGHVLVRYGLWNLYLATMAKIILEYNFLVARKTIFQLSTLLYRSSPLPTWKRERSPCTRNYTFSWAQCFRSTFVSCRIRIQQFPCPDPTKNSKVGT